MKQGLWKGILVLILVFGCKKDQKLNGYYFLCTNGEYVEVYFKKDSMRVASNSEWTKLTEWVKTETNNDTLYYKLFGENFKAKMKHIEREKIEMHNLITDVKFYLKPINKNLNFENGEEFWNGFYKRQNSSNCVQLNHAIMKALLLQLWFESDDCMKPIKNIDKLISEVSKYTKESNDEVLKYLNYLINKKCIKILSVKPKLYEFTEMGKKIRSDFDIQNLIINND